MCAVRTGGCSLSPRVRGRDCGFSVNCTCVGLHELSFQGRGGGGCQTEGVCVCVGQKWPIHVGQNVSVLVQRRGAIGGPEQLDVRPLGLEAALDWGVVCADHRVLEA